MRAKKLFRQIFIYNVLENIALFITLMNSVVYPSASTALYFLFAMGLTLESMTRDEQRIKVKYMVSILFTFAAFSIMVAKGIFLIILNDEGDLQLTRD